MLSDCPKSVQSYQNGWHYPRLAHLQSILDASPWRGNTGGKRTLRGFSLKQTLKVLTSFFDCTYLLHRVLNCGLNPSLNSRLGLYQQFSNNLPQASIQTRLVFRVGLLYEEMWVPIGSREIPSPEKGGGSTTLGCTCYHVWRSTNNRFLLSCRQILIWVTFWVAPKVQTAQGILAHSKSLCWVLAYTHTHRHVNH